MATIFSIPFANNIHAAMAGIGAAGEHKPKKSSSRIAGSALAGATELMLFHPVDTIAKRLMSSKEKYVVSGQTTANINRIVFREKATATTLRKFTSLFPGLGFAAGYKILQRVYKFGGQPFVVDILDKQAGTFFRTTFGEKRGKSLMHATAGSLVGIGEIVLLPLDVLKIKAQTNPNAFKNLGGNSAAASASASGTTAAVKPSMFQVARSIPLSELYKGAGFTAARNAPGSFALFGASQAVHQYVFHLEDSKKATFAQNFWASIAAATASISVAQPFDVVKTRLQNRNFGEKGASGIAVLKNIIVQEGSTALFKGITPKLIVVGPKLVFSYTVAQTLISYFERTL